MDNLCSFRDCIFTELLRLFYGNINGLDWSSSVTVVVLSFFINYTKVCFIVVFLTRDHFVVFSFVLFISTHVTFHQFVALFLFMFITDCIVILLCC